MLCYCLFMCSWGIWSLSKAEYHFAFSYPSVSNAMAVCRICQPTLRYFVKSFQKRKLLIVRSSFSLVCSTERKHSEPPCIQLLSMFKEFNCRFHFFQKLAAEWERNDLEDPVYLDGLTFKLNFLKIFLYFTVYSLLCLQ